MWCGRVLVLMISLSVCMVIRNYQVCVCNNHVKYSVAMRFTSVALTAALCTGIATVSTVMSSR